jgi:hypothetical protein
MRYNFGGSSAINAIRATYFRTIPFTFMYPDLSLTPLHCPPYV